MIKYPPSRPYLPSDHHVIINDQLTTSSRPHSPKHYSLPLIPLRHRHLSREPLHSELAPLAVQYRHPRNLSDPPAEVRVVGPNQVALVLGDSFANAVVRVRSPMGARESLEAGVARQLQRHTISGREFGGNLSVEGKELLYCSMLW